MFKKHISLSFLILIKCFISLHTPFIAAYNPLDVKKTLASALVFTLNHSPAKPETFKNVDLKKLSLELTTPRKVHYDYLDTSMDYSGSILMEMAPKAIRSFGPAAIPVIAGAGLYVGLKHGFSGIKKCLSNWWSGEKNSGFTQEKLDDEAYAYQPCAIPYIHQKAPCKSPVDIFETPKGCPTPQSAYDKPIGCGRPIPQSQQIPKIPGCGGKLLEETIKPAGCGNAPFSTKIIGCEKQAATDIVGDISKYPPAAEDNTTSKDKAANQKIEWTSNGYKHFPKQIPWKETVEETRHGPAKYKIYTNSPEQEIKSFEQEAWKQGTSCNDASQNKVFVADKIIGAYRGKETKYVIIKHTTGNVIHGHPIDEAKYRELTKKE